MAAAGDRRVTVLYCLVARGKVILCDYTLRNSKNLYSVAQDGLSRFHESDDPGSTIVAGDYELHVLRDQVFIFLGITEQTSTPQRSAIFKMLNRVKQDFDQLGLRHRGQTAQDFALRQDFAHILKGLMEECTYGDSQVRALATKTHDVKDQMVENIQTMKERGDKLDELSESTQLLNRSSVEFKRSSSQLRRTMFWRNCRLRCIIATIIIVILVVLLLAIVIPVAVTQSAKNK